MKAVFLFISLIFGLSAVSYAAEMLSSVTLNANRVAQGDLCIITCEIKKPTDLHIDILDAQGKVIRTFFAFQSKRKVDYPWNGKNETGTPVPVGDYTVRVQAGLKPALDATFGVNGALTDFTSPFDVALDKTGNIYLLDHGEKVLHKFTADGKPATDFAKNGKIIFAEGYPPLQSLKVDKLGYIYTSGPFHNVAKYDKKGSFVNVIGGWYIDENGKALPENTINPMGIALGKDKLYLQRGGSDGVVVYNPAFAEKEGFLYLSKGNPMVYSPRPPGIAGTYYGYCGPGLDATEAGVLFGLSLWGTLIKAIDTGADIESKYSANGGPDGTPMQNPTGVAIAPDGSLWVTDWGNGRLLRFYDTGGMLLPVFAFGTQAEGDLKQGCFANPHGLAISADGRYLYLAEDGEPAYNYEAKKPLAFSGAHRLSRWIINEYADTLKAPVTITANGGA